MVVDGTEISILGTVEKSRRSEEATNIVIAPRLISRAIYRRGSVVLAERSQHVNQAVDTLVPIPSFPILPVPSTRQTGSASDSKSYDIELHLRSCRSPTRQCGSYFQKPILHAMSLTDRKDQTETRSPALMSV